MGGEVSQVTAGSWLRPEWINTGEVVVFSFTATGTPKPKQRPRTVRNKNTGFVQTFTPDTTVAWESAVAWQAKQALAWVEVNHPGEVGACLPFAKRVMVRMRFNIARPKSLPKKEQYPLNARSGDVDNLAKSVLDALQNVNVLEDDKRVTDADCYKRFADAEHPEGVEVEITAWL